ARAERILRLIQAEGPPRMSSDAPHTGRSAHHPGYAPSRTRSRPIATRATPVMDMTLWIAAPEPANSSRCLSTLKTSRQARTPPAHNSQKRVCGRKKLETGLVWISQRLSENEINISGARMASKLHRNRHSSQSKSG